MKCTTWTGLVATLALTAASTASEQKPVAYEDPFYEQAIRLMERAPFIDTHIDLPPIIRSLGRQPLDLVPKLTEAFPGHIDIPRLRQGRLGAAFWTVWAPCHAHGGEDPGDDFTLPTHGLRDALEVLELIQALIRGHPDHFAYAHSAADVRRAFADGKVASLIGLEGTHVLGSSLSSMRLLAQLGVRYVTLTHMCHSAFASASGGGFEAAVPPVHPDNGLTDLGRALVRELNRLGVLIDLSHTSDNTSRQALDLSVAPVVWTHSGARAVWDHVRNVPDDILQRIGDGPGQNRGLVHSIFYPPFLAPPGAANVSSVADHVEHIARIVGKNHVGLGSDFDGMAHSAKGLEDASKYPVLVAEFLSRGWTEAEVEALMGGNLLRVMDEVDAVKAQLAAELPSPAVWEKRTDLPAEWGGINDVLYPVDVKEIKRGRVHDEL